jgi:hypothetical protein
LAPFRTSIEPPPHGHNPAMARNDRSLAGTGFAGDQDPLARLDRDIGFAEDSRTVIERNGEVTQAQGRPVGLAIDGNASNIVTRLGLLKCIERNHQ